MVHTILLGKQITLRIVTVDLSTALHMTQYNRKRKKSARLQKQAAGGDKKSIENAAAEQLELGEVASSLAPSFFV